jgi:hypothetical protein
VLGSERKVTTGRYDENTARELIYRRELDTNKLNGLKMCRKTTPKQVTYQCLQKIKQGYIMFLNNNVPYRNMPHQGSQKG